MLGPASGTRSGMAGLVDTYRAHGLFSRWPVEYLATHGDGGAWHSATLALSALRRFTALLATERQLLVHLHSAPERGLWRDALFMSLALAARRPLILQLHGTGLERLHEAAGRAGRALIRLMLEHAACVLVPCEAQRTWIRGVARHARVVLVRAPIACSEPAADAGRPNLVLFLGRLQPEKGLFDLMEAVAALRPAVPDVRLVCAGEGERDAALRHAERLGIADAVRFTAWVGPSGKRALLETASVLALPSYEEAMPLGLLEAMAAGVPVVATPVGGIPEILVDGASGFLVAPGDTATLQRLLRKLLLDRQLAARLGAAARESVRLRCAPQRTLASLGQLYSELGLAAFAEAPEQRPAL
jgi:glycosyltransferase involved in cell wall biosynthesis